MRNLKRALSLLLSSTMVLGMVVMGGSAVGYQDVDASNDNQEAIEVLQAVGIMTGDENGNFNPDGGITRNEMAVVMAHLLNLDYDYYRGTNPFTDVPDWAAPYVAACAAEGVVAGIGNGQYGGNNAVTAAQASLMIMKALGYFQNQEDFGDDWQIATIRQASYINLFNLVDSTAEAALTRGQVAQLVLNGLKAKMVDFTGDKGVQIGDVSVGYHAEYTPRANAANKYNTIDDGTTNINKDDQYYVQLGEELYNGELKLSSSTVDAFGRPTRTWTYEENKIGSYVKNELLYKEYTTAVTGEELYELLGSNVRDKYTFNIAVDGETTRNVLGSAYFTENQIAKSYDETVGATGKGVLTQVYVDTQAQKVNIAVINTYLAKAVEDYDEKNNELDLEVYKISDNGHADHYVKAVNDETMTVSGEDFDIANVADGDLYLVTVADGEIQTMADPQILAESTITSFSKTKYVVSDGTQYDYASTARYDVNVLDNYTGISDTVNLKDLSYNIILDPYGYLIGIELVEDPTQYLFLTGLDLNDSYLGAKNADANVIFTDGTMKTVNVDLRSSRGLENNGTVSTSNGTLLGGDLTSASKGQLNTWCTYTVDSDGVYSLRRVATINNAKVMQTAQDAASGTVEINKSHVSLDGAGKNTEAVVAPGTSVKPYSKVYGNDETVYITVDNIVDLMEITEPNIGRTVTIIDDVDSAVVGKDNVDVEVSDLANLQDNDGTPVWANNPPDNEIYTLHDDDGYVIATVVIGEDQGTTTNYAYIIDDVTKETYDSAADEWSWTRPAVVNGQIVDLKEVGDNLHLLDALKVGYWYEVRYDADGNVRKVSKAIDFTSTYTIGSKYVGNSADIQTAIDDDVDTLLVFLDYCRNTWDSATLGNDAKDDQVTNLSFKGNTLFIDTLGSDPKGFSVSPDVNVVLALSDKNHVPFDNVDDSYTGSNGLEKALRNLDTEAVDVNNDGLVDYTFEGHLSFVMEDGVITSIVLNDYTGPRDNTVSAAAPRLTAGASASLVSATTGDKVTLSVTVGAAANGRDYGTLSYQWYKIVNNQDGNGNAETDDIAVGTNSPSLTVTAADGDKYYCVVTNYDNGKDITGEIRTSTTSGIFTISSSAAKMDVQTRYELANGTKVMTTGIEQKSAEPGTNYAYIAKAGDIKVVDGVVYEVVDTVVVPFYANSFANATVEVEVVGADLSAIDVPEGLVVEWAAADKVSATDMDGDSVTYVKAGSTATSVSTEAGVGKWDGTATTDVTTETVEIKNDGTVDGMPAASDFGYFKVDIQVAGDLSGATTKTGIGIQAMKTNDTISIEIGKSGWNWTTVTNTIEVDSGDATLADKSVSVDNTTVTYTLTFIGTDDGTIVLKDSWT